MLRAFPDDSPRDARVYQLAEETEADWWEVEALLDLCFAPGRTALSSYRLRDGVPTVAALCLTLRDDDGTLAAAIRYWPVEVGGQDALLLGPVAVHPTRQGEGLGGLLINESLAEARRLGWERVMLVGDAPYYARFGFKRLQGVVMPPGSSGTTCCWTAWQQRCARLAGPVQVDVAADRQARTALRASDHEAAIEASRALLTQARRGDPALPALDVAQVRAQLGGGGQAGHGGIVAAPDHRDEMLDRCQLRRELLDQGQCLVPAQCAQGEGRHRARRTGQRRVNPREGDVAALADNLQRRGCRRIGSSVLTSAACVTWCCMSCCMCGRVT